MGEALWDHDRHLPDVWGEGALFAFSGLDGPTETVSGFVGSYGRTSHELLFHTPRRRVFSAVGCGDGRVRLALGDVLAIETERGPFVAAYDAWHSLVGLLPDGARVALAFEDGEPAQEREGCLVVLDAAHGDCLAVAQRGMHFGLAFGRTVDEACARASAAAERDVWDVAAVRLRPYAQLPHVPDVANGRLLAKCYSVMRVNTLAAEGCIARTWSTPDRVPHKDMWLWDTVFHSLAMNHFSPQVAWEELQAVLDQQGPDGMIPHQMSVTGKRSAITQPPLLAWGVWENYRALGDREVLRYALPRLERYLAWDLAQRDDNGNGLLEWFIEGSPLCRSGESGMDNSPRFDRAIALDAVDFSTFAAQDLRCAARIARELDQVARAGALDAQAARIEQQLEALLWDDATGLFYDRPLSGDLERVQAASAFMPLLLPGLSDAKADRLVQALRDPARFGAPFPVPSVALNEPTWGTDMWRGATWVNLNYLIVRGLCTHGRQADADWLAERTVAMVQWAYEEHGVLFEFFDAKGQTPPTQLARKGAHREPYDIRVKMDSIRDYHWTAALTACLLLERHTEQTAQPKRF
ncbi:MAG: amylo-alpha-1,6-glucosidase [Anaerolineae bacterium]